MPQLWTPILLFMDGKPGGIANVYIGCIPCPYATQLVSIENVSSFQRIVRAWKHAHRLLAITKTTRSVRILTKIKALARTAHSLTDVSVINQLVSSRYDFTKPELKWDFKIEYGKESHNKFFTAVGTTNPAFRFTIV